MQPAVPLGLQPNSTDPVAFAPTNDRRVVGSTQLATVNVPLPSQAERAGAISTIDRRRRSGLGAQTHSRPVSSGTARGDDDDRPFIPFVVTPTNPFGWVYSYFWMFTVF